MNRDAFQREDWLLGGAALLLIIDLLFLPWFSVPVSLLGVHLTYTTTATGSFDGWSAVIAVLVCAAIILDIIVERLRPDITVPNLGAGRTQTRYVLALVAVGFVALKFVLHIHFGYFGFAFYAAIVLCAALVDIARRANGAPGYVPRIR